MQVIAQFKLIEIVRITLEKQYATSELLKRGYG